MQAARIHRFGGAEEVGVETVPVPVPAASQLLVKVRAASLNPVDYKTRAGRFPPVTAAMLPITLGRDLSGSVAGIGGQGGGFRTGDAVIALLSPSEGAFAEYALVTPAQAAVKPDRLSHADAAALPLAGLAAWQGLMDHGHLQSGQRVLIHGGAGGVGHLAVQFAKQRGAFVFATVSARDVGFMHELGVDRPIDYAAERFEEVAADLDLVLDLIGGETQARSLPLVRRGGALVSTLAPPPPEACAAAGITGAHFVARPNGVQLAEIARLVEEGHVRVTVAERFPLARAREAQQRLEQGGVRGKLVLEIQ
jgi:NADPH:quinone reductase-like Zn-dependent oxidoreductase